MGARLEAHGGVSIPLTDNWTGAATPHWCGGVGSALGSPMRVSTRALQGPGCLPHLAASHNHKAFALAAVPQTASAGGAF